MVSENTTEMYACKIAWDILDTKGSWVLAGAGVFVEQKDILLSPSVFVKRFHVVHSEFGKPFV